MSLYKSFVSSAIRKARSLMAKITAAWLKKHREACGGFTAPIHGHAVFKTSHALTSDFYSVTTLCLKKTSPTFLAITRESIDGFL